MAEMSRQRALMMSISLFEVMLRAEERSADHDDPINKEMAQAMQDAIPVLQEMLALDVLAGRLMTEVGPVIEAHIEHLNSPEHRAEVAKQERERRRERRN